MIRCRRGAQMNLLALPELRAAKNPEGPAVKLDIDAIGEHLRESLSKYKLPVEITILEDPPKNAVGKIAKPSLRQLLAANH
jgi:acyl-CoA synthetase (AMP-forming)/AMP-acid ligase II